MVVVWVGVWWCVCDGGVFVCDGGVCLCVMGVVMMAVCVCVWVCVSVRVCVCVYLMHIALVALTGLAHNCITSVCVSVLLSIIGFKANN